MPADEATSVNGDNRIVGYWWLIANPEKWSFSAIDVDTEKAFMLKDEETNKPRRIIQNFIDVKAGDAVICYETNPTAAIVALARISKASDGKKIIIKKTDNLISPIKLSELKSVPVLREAKAIANPRVTLHRLKKEEFEVIMKLVRAVNPIRYSGDAAETGFDSGEVVGLGMQMPGSSENQESVPDDYSEADFLKEVYMSERDRSHLAGLLENKKNIILQGVPGVGKTFAAKRLAWSVLGKKDKKRVRMVQFHQSYSYDEFVMGYRPNGTGFERTPGIFYDFCKDAENDPGNKYFFIIDEINRGNLSKIFGELLMLIENSHRGDPIDLSYKKPCEDGNGGTVWQREEFSVPGNLYLIGTMNTVDRGLTKFDHALRQRFGVFTMHPAFESDGFKKYLEERNSEKLSALIAETKKLDNEIADSLGKDFVIGHRWFCRGDDEAVTDEWLYSIVEYDILPLLEEYWFDQEENVDRWSRKLHEVLGVEDAR